MLNAFSTGFDDQLDDIEVVTQFLRGVNPLAKTCLVRDSDGRHVMTGVQIGTDSLRSIAEARLKPDAKGWRRYDKARAEVSETLAFEALAAVLQTPPQHANLKYLAPKEGVSDDALGRTCSELHVLADQTEADGLFPIEGVAICASKSCVQSGRGDRT